MLEWLFDHQGENLGAEIISASSAVVRKRRDGMKPQLVPIQPATGSPVSHFEVNQAHPM